MTRADWSQSQTYCWLCGWSAYRWSARWLETHEIARGPARQRAMKEPAAWIRACNRCHEELGNYSQWPVVRQLALKKLRDPKHYDRVAVNRLRGRQDEAITEAEVDKALAELKRKGL